MSRRSKRRAPVYVSSKVTDMPATPEALEIAGVADVAPAPIVCEPDKVADEPTSPVPVLPVPEGYMRDARGRLVPAALVKPEQLLEDTLVRRVHATADKLSELLREFRESSFGAVDELLGILADKYGVTLGGTHGNLTLDTYDGTLIVQVSIGDQIDLGPELVVAKALIDGCIHRWSQGASVELQALVNDAFDVDKKGNINVGRVLALRRMNIDDADWRKAMEAIANAVRVVRSKRYLRLYRKTSDQPKAQVPLDLASV
jgi:hypothetical protein